MSAGHAYLTLRRSIARWQAESRPVIPDQAQRVGAVAPSTAAP